MTSRRLLCALLPLLTACSSDVTTPKPASASAAPLAGTPVSRVRQLRGAFGVASPARPGRVEATDPHDIPSMTAVQVTRVDREGAFFVPRFAEIAKGSTAKGAHVAIPVRANEAFTVRDRASGVGVDVMMECATAVEGHVEDGFVVYPSGHASGADVLHRPSREGTEDWVYFVTRPVEEALRYRVTLLEVAGLRLVSETLEFLDRDGMPRLRMAPPYGIDVAGNRVEMHVDVVGCAVDTSPRLPWGRAVTGPGATACEVHVSWAEGAQYPLLVDPPWTTTGSMATARWNHTASVLKDGRVLIAGGYHYGALGSAEVFDPAGGSWASAAPMAVLRYAHTASVLADGRVIVAGGTGKNGTPLADVETFEATAGWAGAASMTTARTFHSTSVLADGRVLVAGGLGVKNNLDSTEVFDPTNGGSWASAGAMMAARGHHTGSVLADGRVLVAGGFDASAKHSVLPSVEVFNPSGAGSWTSAGKMSTPRADHTANVLADGRVLFVGGSDGSMFTLASIELFDPAGGGQSMSTTLTAHRAAHTATALPDGRVLVAGGYDWLTIQGSVDAFIPSGAGSWATAGSLATGRATHTASVLADGRVLVAGGEKQTPDPQADAYLASAEIFGGISQGFACFGGTCASGLFCVDGVCCDSACTISTACTLAKTGLPDGQCGLRANGMKCASSAACASATCTDGVCCESPCSGPCEACSAAKSGVADGTCAPIPNNKDPDNECNPAGSGVCALPGVCDGQGSCKSHPGLACGGASCPSKTTLQPPRACDAKGSCVPSKTVSCGNYTCRNGACLESCEIDADCADTLKCVGYPNGTCIGGSSGSAGSSGSTGTSGGAGSSGSTGSGGAGGTASGGTAGVKGGGAGTPMANAGPHSAGGCGCRTARDDSTPALPLLLAAFGAIFARRRRGRSRTRTSAASALHDAVVQ